MNIQKLRDALNYLREEPLRLEMGLFIQSNTNRFTKPPCGTVSCIAGTAILLEAKQRKIGYFDLLIYLQMEHADAACEILELTLEEGRKLFHVESWPEKYAYAYIQFDNAFKYQRIAHPHVLAFIAKARFKVLDEYVKEFILNAHLATLQQNSLPQQ